MFSDNTKCQNKWPERALAGMAMQEPARTLEPSLVSICSYASLVLPFCNFWLTLNFEATAIT